MAKKNKTKKTKKSKKVSKRKVSKKPASKKTDKNILIYAAVAVLALIVIVLQYRVERRSQKLKNKLKLQNKRMLKR